MAADPDWMWNQNVLVEHADAISALLRERRAHPIPTKPAMYDAGPEAFLEGWLPRRPLIDGDSKVIAIGSCFAALFSQWLADNGFNRSFDARSDESLLRNPLDSPVTVAQQFRWAFGEFDPGVAVWYRSANERFEATEERRRTLASMLREVDVVIVTLGLAEVWWDVQTDEPIWRVPRGERGRYESRVLTVRECVAALETIERLRAAHMSQARILYTVSPVRFRVTFRPISALVANVASKAIVRAALDEFLRSRPDVGSTYFYFPSYEIVRELLVDPYVDNRHVRREYSDRLIRLFARHYTSLPAQGDVTFPSSEAAELRETIARLEAANQKLQDACDERLVVIEDLKRVCDERLELIERLSA